eukprot:GILK01004083.1.p1 GENE.GILK01004083.1~~GILK01004083.1.p1  ORF type:complete len:182 (+),score=23.73 GILK01004083.1:166-711(+)
MGPAISKLWSLLTARREFRMLMLGLDAAGKTTILYKFKLGEVVTTIPTIGFNVETLTYRNLNMTVWDVGGQHKLRPLWHHYYHGTDGLIFVVDASDHDRVDEVQEELQRLLAEDSLRDAHVLVFANKQDLPGAMDTRTLAEKLELTKARNRHWYVQSACAVTGEGIYEGLDWLTRSLLKAK